MNILVTICARAGSKGVKSKNLRDFLERPICYYTLAALDLFIIRYGNEYGDITLAVNTDAVELRAQIERAGFRFIAAPRRESLAGDTASKIDVIRDTLRYAEEQTGGTYDVVVDMDLTSPLRRVEDIRNIIEALAGTAGAEVALSVTEARRNPYFNQLVRGEDGFLHTAIESNFVARQQAPEILDANASLYAYSPAFLRGSDAIILKAKLVSAMMPDTGILDIDSERDFELMQVIARYLYQNDPLYGEVRDHIASFFEGNKP